MEKPVPRPAAWMTWAAPGRPPPRIVMAIRRPAARRAPRAVKACRRVNLALFEPAALPVAFHRAGKSRFLAIFLALT